MEGGKPVVIANIEGMRTTPSVVAFSKEGEQLVGQMARRQAVLNPQNTFYGIKRFMGRRYSELSPETRKVPYTIRRDDLGNVKVVCPRLDREFAPEEISAMILRKLAEEANRYLGQSVTGAVITVPAYFNDAQRQATRDAGRIAGLEVLRILNEPTAASLAYGLERRESQTILVFDLGGGTFDVSILDIGDGVFEVRATSGDTQLGGVDFDKKIVDWLAEQFLEQEQIDLRRDRQSLQRLTEAAEKAKIELSGVTSTEINLPFIAATADGPKHLETRLTRKQFEGLCADLVSRLRGPVKQAFRDADLTPDDIDEVVLVGGSTRMPMVKELVRSLIDREPNENVNPDEVVAVGAAIQAGILTREVQDILLLDVTPLSLGVETIGGVMKKLIPRNTTIPVRRSDIFSTSENNQTMVEVHVVQGEREMANDNKSLGRFKLMGIPPAPRGVPQVLVSLDIDANGILQVTAVDKTTGREQGLTIQGASALSDAEIQRMIKEAEQFSRQDREKRERVEKRTNAEALTYQAERQLREVALDFGMQFASSYRRRIENLIQELRDALGKNDERGIDVTEAELQDALADLRREIYQFNQEEEEEGGFFGSIKRAILGDDDDDYPFERRDSWDDRDRWNDRRDSWDAPRRNTWDDRDRWDSPPPRRSAQNDWDAPRRDGFSQREGVDRRDSFERRDNFDRRDSYSQRDSLDRRDVDRRDDFDRRDSLERRDRPDSRPANRPDNRGRDDWENGTRRSTRDGDDRNDWGNSSSEELRGGRRNSREPAGREPDPRNNRDSWDQGDRNWDESSPRSARKRTSYDDVPRSRGEWDDEDDWL
jgi:molecular chaperone DnaK